MPTDNTQLEKNLLKQSYSNSCLLNYQTCSYLSKQDDSTHSLPILLKEQRSFAHIIAEEKYNLQFFPSFRQRRATTDIEKDKKNSMIYGNNDDDEITTVCASRSSHFSLSASLSVSSAKKAKPTSTYFAHDVIGISNISRKRRMRCIQRHISHMNNDQTKAALCFILQLNSYFDKNVLSLRKDNNKCNENFLKLEKLDDVSQKIIKDDTNTISSLKFISHPKSYNTNLTGKHDSINISMELSNNSNSLSQFNLQTNAELLAISNRSIMKNTLNRTTNKLNSYDLSSGDKNNMYSITHLFPEKQSKLDNQQTLISNINHRFETIIDCENKNLNACCCHLTKNKATTVPNIFTDIFTPEKHDDTTKLITLPEFNDQLHIDLSEPKIASVANISAIPLQRILPHIKSPGRTETQDLASDKTEINIHQQTTILNSSITDHNYHTSESSIDLHRLLNESNETKSTPPLYSRCLVSFEFANREEHSVEVVELPRLFYRASRLDVYMKVRERLVSMNLIDIDLSALLRNILQTFHN